MPAPPTQPNPLEPSLSGPMPPAPSEQVSMPRQPPPAQNPAPSAVPQVTAALPPAAPAPPAPKPILGELTG